MKYSYTWLKELSGTKKTPKQLAELLTMRAFEFEDSKTEGKETQMEFSVLPNRAHDALSHVGMAREICACENRKFDFLTSDVRKFLTSDVRKLKIEIKDKKLCPRYIGAVLGNIKVAPSPKWLQERLLVSGIKPINNIVDITNYVMLEVGQPLHAFDAAKISNQGSMINIVVRKAKKEEEIKLLDEKIYKLDENDLIIADSEKPIALAGVMGGLDSAVTAKTTSIILESANFNSTNVRKTRMRHNIITESSYRFERDIDPNLAELGAARAIELLKETGGGNVEVAAIADIYPKRIRSWDIKLDTEYVSKLLGEKIPVVRMKNILENLGLKILGNRISKRTWKPNFQVEIPTVRIDLQTQEDLIEEIGRIYGYENIKEQAPVVEVKTPPQNEKRDFENKLRDILAGLGFSEVMNYSFYGAEDIAKCNLKTEDHVEVANPLSSEQQYLRWSMMPNLIKSVKTNLKNFEEFGFFEIGRKFFFEKNKIPKEKTILAAAVINPSAKNGLFLELKGKLESLLDNLGCKNTQYSILNTQYLFWHPTRAARIVSHGKELGYIGEIDPTVLKKYGISSRVAAFGIKIDELLELPKVKKIFESLAKYPSVKRDISMFVGSDIKYADIEKTIIKAGGKLVLGIELFDVFKREGEKSLALRIKVGSDLKTLTSAEIDAVMKKIISALEKDSKVKVRK